MKGLLSFEQLYEQYYQKVYYFLQRISNNSSLAEDLTQETFLQAYTSFHKFRGECEVLTWLIAIGKHVYFKYLKKHKLQLDSANLDIVVDTYYENNIDPQEILDRQDIKRALKQMVEEMPKKYKDVVVLRIYAQLSFAEIGAVLHIQENSAKVIYFRAKKRLMEVACHEFRL